MTVIISFLFSACTRELDKTYLVSAVCFENEGGNILATAEYISVPDTDKASGYSAKTIKASGEGTEASISRLSASLTKPLFFEHCAVVMLDKSLTKSQITDIFTYLKKGEIPFSAHLVYAENSRILTAKTDSNPSVGYTLAYLLKNRAESFGYSGHTRIYEIITARKQEENIFALPKVSLKDDKLSAEQMVLYKNDMPSLKLDVKESIYYAMARNVYKGGRIEIKDKVETLPSTKIKEIKTEDENLTLEINITNSEIITELENFLNTALKKGINFFQKKDIKNITVKGESLN